MNNYDLPIEEVEKLDCNPVTNKDAIVFIKQPDGNWRGFMNRDGRIIQDRQSDPGIVLSLLITHE